MARSCPKCRDFQVHREKRKGLREFLLSLQGIWPFHCESCGTDFYMARRNVDLGSGLVAEPKRVRSSRS